MNFGKVVFSGPFVCANGGHEVKKKGKNECEKLCAGIINFRFMLKTYDDLSNAMFSVKR